MRDIRAQVHILEDMEAKIRTKKKRSKVKGFYGTCTDSERTLVLLSILASLQKPNNNLMINLMRKSTKPNLFANALLKQ
jgi:hypothetical protein